MLFVAFFALLLSSCAIYEPYLVDCSITCSADGACPEGTNCSGGFCRTPGANTLCNCREGEERPCGVSEGVCSPGVQRCVNASWSACVGAVAASTETCNALDDDCNGIVDEGVPPRSCPLFKGVCAESASRCANGTWTPCNDLEYGPFFERSEQQCDGRDNDCDGFTDVTPQVLLGSVERAWSFGSTGDGYAFVRERDGGMELEWLDAELQRQSTQPRQGALLAVSFESGAVAIASMTEDGVELARLQRDGGIQRRLVTAWRDAQRVQLGGSLAAAGLDGSVQLVGVDDDGGVPVIVGLAAPDGFELEQQGLALALPDRIIEPRSGSVLRTGGPGPLRALISPSPAVLVGVPRDQPEPPLVFPNLLVDDRLMSFSTSTVLRLSDLQVTVHRGRVLMGGISETGMWAVTPTSSWYRELANVSRAQPATAAAGRYALAWQAGTEVWASFVCDP